MPQRTPGKLLECRVLSSKPRSTQDPHHDCHGAFLGRKLKALEHGDDPEFSHLPLPVVPRQPSTSCRKPKEASISEIANQGSHIGSRRPFFGVERKAQFEEVSGQGGRNLGHRRPRQRLGDVEDGGPRVVDAGPGMTAPENRVAFLGYGRPEETQRHTTGVGFRNYARKECKDSSDLPNNVV
jgi:hypothetical protein